MDKMAPENVKNWYFKLEQEPMLLTRGKKRSSASAILSMEQIL